MKANKLILTLLVLAFSLVIKAQNKKEKQSEHYKVDKDITLDIDTRYVDVIIDTWSKNEVEITAHVEGDVDQEKLQKAISDWQLDIQGNKSYISINSKRGKTNLDLPDLDNLHIDIPLGEVIEGSIGIVEPVVKGIVGPLLEGLTGENLPPAFYQELNSVKFDHEAYRKEGKAYLKRYERQVENSFGSDFDKAMDKWGASLEKKDENHKKGALHNLSNIPTWPFGKTGSMQFDTDKYEKNKKAYVASLNKKYDTNVSVNEVDNWLKDLDDWSEKFEVNMEEWADDFELKMEGFGEKMEDFGASMEEWGESFGKSMEKLGAKFEKWADELEVESKHYDKNGRRTKGSENKSKRNTTSDSKIRRVLKIYMPEKATINMDVKYGKVKMVNAFNPRIRMDYGEFTANNIDGGATTIDIAYSPLTINSINGGTIEATHVKECTIHNANDIVITAASSDLMINEIDGSSMISGSFGKLSLPQVASDFSSLSLMLENSDMVLELPESSFNFSYSGERNDLIIPSNLETKKMGSGNSQLINGYHIDRNTSRVITISAKYSDVVLK